MNWCCETVKMSVPPGNRYDKRVPSFFDPPSYCPALQSTQNRILYTLDMY
jgi:hypothetical protein